ncbi:MAG: restriction endonuclease subunit S, partial [Ruminococcus sp.]|nr:restriction endonuclease subunit S [Ruminococcus sp.]
MKFNGNSLTWGDLITLEYGKPISDKNSTDGKVPVFGTNGKIGTSHLTPLCKIPSFIVGRKGAYRGVHYSNIPFSVIDTAFYAMPISDELDMKWAYYKFLTYDINRMNSGSAIPSTDRYEIYRIPVTLPPVSIQKRIVSILDSISDKITLNNA